MLTYRKPFFSCVAAGSFILCLNLTTNHMQTSKSRTLTTPATTPPKKVPTPRGALVAVAVCVQGRQQANIRRQNSTMATLVADHQY